MRKIKLIILILGIAHITMSQEQLLVDNQFAEAEIHSAINPLDSNHIVVAAIRRFEEFEDTYISIYYTFDFGLTWSQSAFKGFYGNQRGAVDPVLAFDASGTLYLTNLVKDNKLMTMVSKSIDGGETWGQLYLLDTHNSDKPWISIDRSETSTNKGNIYIVTVIDKVQLITLNSNGEVLNQVEIPDGNHIPSLVVDNEGSIFTSSMKWTNPPYLMFCQQYMNQGQELVHSSLSTVIPFNENGESDISNNIQPTPYLAIDNSNGPFAGRLYLTYTSLEENNPEYYDVMLTYSDDNGINWSEPKALNEQNLNLKQQYYSSIFVNNKGTLILDWYDRSNYDSNSLNTDFYMGISHNGSESFEYIRLTSEPMDFNFALEAGFGFGIGDYHQLVATDNTAMSFWSDGRTNDGNLNIFFSKVDLNNPISELIEIGEIENQVKISNVFPQPAQDLINVEIELKESHTVKTDIFSISGQLIERGNWTNYSPGLNTISKAITLPSGSYIMQLKFMDGISRNLKFTVS